MDCFDDTTPMDLMNTQKMPPLSFKKTQTNTQKEKNSNIQYFSSILCDYFYSQQSICVHERQKYRPILENPLKRSICHGSLIIVLQLHSHSLHCKTLNELSHLRRISEDTKWKSTLIIYKYI